MSPQCVLLLRAVSYFDVLIQEPPFQPKYRACALRCGGRPNMYIKLIYETVCGIYIPCDNTLWEMA